jgi:hypothetical protein
MTQFSDLNLNPKILKAIEEAGYTTPTPIQAGAIPAALEGRDVLGIAQTGTGKLWRVAARARGCRGLWYCAPPVNLLRRWLKILIPTANM